LSRISKEVVALAVARPNAAIVEAEFERRLNPDPDRFGGRLSKMLGYESWELVAEW
jgi:hypothetical protein